MKQTNQYGAIASGHDLTSQAGIDVLKQGGNAFDAAIASSFMACVCEPILASPGGGGFANIHTPTENYILDFFVQTPLNKNPGEIDFRAIQADFGTTTQTFHIGTASSATPGFVSGLLDLYNTSASLDLETLLAPAITAAQTGVIVSQFQYYLSTVVEPILRATTNAEKIFAPNGQLITAGSIFQNPWLSEFFKAIIANKQDAFPATHIVNEDQEFGHLAQADFDTYRPIKRVPKSFQIGNNNIALNPLPAASGVLIALALKQLQAISKPTTLDIAQALSHADIARSASNNDLNSLKAQLNAPAYRGTTHISVVDKNHNACSITLSNGEGNGHIVDDCGFMLNNMLGETDVNPDGKRGWKENTRLSSMMCPTIVDAQNGHLYALGSGGSNRIRSTITQVLINLLINHQDPTPAINAPRLHPEDGHLDFEQLYNDQTITDLKSAFKDHRAWPEKNMFFGGCHLVGIAPDGTFFGCGDERRNGSYKAC